MNLFQAQCVIKCCHSWYRVVLYCCTQFLFAYDSELMQASIWYSGVKVPDLQTISHVIEIILFVMCWNT